VLRNGTDVTIIASGIMVVEAMNAAKILQTQGVSARVIDIFTWKPIDAQLITTAAAETGAIVTAENHNITGGLFSAVTEVTSRHCAVPVEVVGIFDSFGQVGPESYLRTAYGLTDENIIKAALRAIERKRA